MSKTVAAKMLEGFYEGEQISRKEALAILQKKYPKGKFNLSDIDIREYIDGNGKIVWEIEVWGKPCKHSSRSSPGCVDFFDTKGEWVGHKCK